MTEVSSSHSNQLTELLVQAYEHRQRQDYGKAIGLYHSVVEQLGETADMDQALAHCYFQLGLVEGDYASFLAAELWCKRAIELAPTNSHYHVDLGQTYSLGVMDYQAAADEYRTAIALDPNNRWAFMGGAALYGVPEDVVTLPEALEWLERIVKLEPHDPNGHFRLGELYCEAGRPIDAATEWRKALLCPLPLDAGSAQTIRKSLSAG